MENMVVLPSVVKNQASCMGFSEGVGSDSAAIKFCELLSPSCCLLLGQNSVDCLL